MVPAAPGALESGVADSDPAVDVNFLPPDDIPGYTSGSTGGDDISDSVEEDSEGVEDAPLPTDEGDFSLPNYEA